MRLTPLKLNLPSSANSFEEANIQLLVQRSTVMWLKNNPEITVIGNDGKLFRLLETALEKIESTDTGRSLLDCIASVSRLKSENLNIYLNCSTVDVIAHCSKDAKNFRGTGSDMFLNLNMDCFDPEQGMSLTDFHACVVFHELTHVLHNLQGERLRVEYSHSDSQMQLPMLLEEARTVGLGSYSRELSFGK